MTTGEQLADRVEEAQFAPVRVRQGYVMGEVDDFLDELARRLRAGEPVDAFVASATFSHGGWRESYAIDQVEALLTEVAPGAGRAAVAAVAPELSRDSVIEEHPGLLGRLFGSRG